MMRYENDSSQDSHFDDDHDRHTSNHGTNAVPGGDAIDNSSREPVVNPQQLLNCPICEHKFFRNDTPAMPFCSRRCQQVDMGRWLTESYGMPYDSEDALPLDDEEYESGF